MFSIFLNDVALVFLRAIWIFSYLYHVPDCIYTYLNIEGPIHGAIRDVKTFGV